MRNRILATTLLTIWAACGLTAAAQRATSKRLDVASYARVMQKTFALAANGQIDQAMTYLEQNVALIDGGTPTRRGMEALFRAGGEYDGCEVVAAKIISRRLHLVFLVAYFVEGPRLVTFRSYSFKDVWSLSDFNFAADLQVLEAELPMTSLASPRPAFRP